MIATKSLWTRLRCIAAALAVLSLAAGSLPAQTEANQPTAVLETEEDLPWSGRWRSYWRGGQALTVLRQTEDRVTGTYQPGDGSIDGQIEGAVVRGTWEQPGAEGTFEFALAPDGESFVGRFGNGEYWNGEKIAGFGSDARAFGAETPKAALASVVSAINAALAGDSFAELLIRRYLTFVDSETGVRAQNARILLLTQMINAATFRLIDAPEVTEAPADGTPVSFEISPDGLDWSFELNFDQDERGAWSVAVPPLEVLERTHNAMLAAADAPSYEAFRMDRQTSVRETLRQFYYGTQTFRAGGREEVLATFDLSEVPPSLRDIDGPIAAEYLNQIFARLGVPIWQEFPDDPLRPLPYAFYENAGGKIVIDRFETEDGGVQWLFTSDTLKAAPTIYESIQNLPVAAGVSPQAPLTRAGVVRGYLRGISPDLLERRVLLENWQWLALAAAVLFAVVGALVLQALARLVVTGIARLFRAAPETRADLGRALGWPARIFAGGGILLLAVREIGVRQDLSVWLNGKAVLLMILGGTFFFYFLVDAIARALARSANSTDTKIDDIGAVIGGGIAKIAVIVGGAVIAAELLGLPYEGVIAALGIGGLALGFAARDAVSNFISAGILVSDRPFKTGDLIEANGQLGVVEEVGLRSTRLRTLDDALLILPNSQLSEGQVNNWGRLRQRRVDLTLGLTYDTPRAKIDDFTHKVRDMFEAYPNAKPGVHVSLDSFGASSIDVRVLGYFNTSDFKAFLAAKHKLIGDLIDLAAQEGVEFAFPTTTLHMTEPADVLSGRFAAPQTAAE